MLFRSTESIKKNVGVVGLSGGIIEPLEATSLFLTYLMVIQLNKHLSDNKPANVLNRNLKKIFDHTANYVLFHYTLSGKKHNEYWRYFNELENKLKTLDYMKEMASKPDTKQWKNELLFHPYHHWALLDGYGIN